MKTNSIRNNVNQAIALSVPWLSPSYLFKVVVAIVLLLTFITRGAHAQCVAPSLTFNSPKLIAGTVNTIGAVYLFPDVVPGVDAHVEIMDIVGGASLAEIDNTTAGGYFDAFQPFIWNAPNDTSFIDWKITFKIASTNTDTVFECLAVTAIDVDGNNKDLKEFVEAATPGSFAVDPFTVLTVSFDGIRSKAEGQITTIPLIDTAHREAMFQMNFINISSLLYRNGAITTGIAMVRQTCIYFKPFFTDFTILPIKLLSFTSQSQNNGVALNWSATNEQEIKNYTVQKSTDGKTWRSVGTINTGISLTNTYRYMDQEKNNGITYYRLQQNSVKGFKTYSKVIMMGTANSTGNKFSHNTVFSNSINLNIYATGSNEYVCELYSLNGSKIKQQRAAIHSGNNTLQIQIPENINDGIYILSVKDNKGQQAFSSKLIKD